MLCAISNAVPEEPVANVKTGHVYERSLIEKYLHEFNKCPMTGQPMSQEDLISLKAGKPVKPRHTTAMHIPGILGLLHNEYDAVMLECFDLRKELAAARQQLAHSLYQHDAGCRVIARLIRDKDALEANVEQLRAALSGAQHELSQAQRGAEAGPAGDEPDAKRARQVRGLSEEEVADVDAKCDALYKMRNSRKNMEFPGMASREELAQLAVAKGIPLHSATQPGILALALQPVPHEQKPELVATGGADTDIHIYDLNQEVLVSSLSGHAKRVTSLIYPTLDTIVSGSSDCTVRVWGCSSKEAGGDAQWSLRAVAPTTFKHRVLRVCAHPLTKYIIAVDQETWQMVDSEKEELLWTCTDDQASQFTCVGVHPDGRFLATGTTAAGLRMYDVKTASLLASLHEGVEGAVRDISFHENGYWAALACETGVQIRDLRNMNKALEVAPFDKAAPTCVAWDYAGKYLACGGPTVKIYEVNKGKKKGADAQVVKSILDLPQKGVVNCLAFSGLGHSLFVGAGDHSLRHYVC